MLFEISDIEDDSKEIFKETRCKETHKSFTIVLKICWTKCFAVNLFVNLSYFVLLLLEVIDLESLASQVYTSIIQREFLETRHNTVEDDGLIGLLNLMSNILKHNPSFKTGKEGQDLLNEVNMLSNSSRAHLRNSEVRIGEIKYLSAG